MAAMAAWRFRPVAHVGNRFNRFIKTPTPPREQTPRRRHKQTSETRDQKQIYGDAQNPNESQNGDARREQIEEKLKTHHARYDSRRRVRHANVSPHS